MGICHSPTHDGRSWSRILESYAAWADIARRGAEVLGTDTPGGARMDEMSQFADILRRYTAQAIERWRRIHAAQRRRMEA
jgi:hypothetical protein